MRGANHTTAPASSPRSTVGGAGEGEGQLAIQWVFPTTDGPLTPLPGPKVVLGRGEDCGTVLRGSEISRYHAEVIREGPVAVLRDLGSLNGSFVNAQPTKEAPLDLRDVVRLGEWVGVVVALPAQTSGAAAPAHARIAPDLYGGPTLRAAVDPALRAARSDLSIVIEGETGTGKEVVARAIHAESGRGGAFVAVNCAALPEGLAEAELFGYRRGAFTGADRASPGHFRAAHGGTLLLDEISDLPPASQAKVLRVLEQREVMPLGESQPVPVDVRIVVAAQEPLDRAVSERRFRGDLYARLDGLTVRLPPLRERIEDAPYLFARLLHAGSGGKPPSVEPRLVERLCLYDWPFNVRELVTLVRRMLVLHGQEPSLRVAHLPARLRAGRPEAAAPAAAGARPAEPDAAERDREDFDRLLTALRAHGGNVSRAAAAAGLSRQRSYRLMQARPEVDLGELRRGGDPQGPET
jgi:transcriptional regulator of acetoin/glycerol metabolism